jgi:hypothetical protein
MENHHFKWVNPLYGHFQYFFVCLPEHLAISGENGDSTKISPVVKT